MKPKPLIIPVFIPQEGCQHRCVYCDQATISGSSQTSWSSSSLQQYVQRFLASSARYPIQVAFYGGTFTALPEARQRLFLESVQDFLKRGQVHWLRLSTRPDAIEEENLRFLLSMGVKTIELGAQSLNDKVLFASARGHSSGEVRKAALTLHRYGFELGLQLMPGLPEDNRETFLQTVDGSIGLRPDFVRLYPTVVLAGTPLERLYRQGRYRPLSLDQAIDWCREAKLRFARAGIAVVRLGLQPTASLEQGTSMLAGPYHPAFGQLVRSAIWYERIYPVLKKASRLSLNLKIHAPSQDLADIRGHCNANLKRWLETLQLISLTTAVWHQTPSEGFAVTAH